MTQLPTLSTLDPLRVRRVLMLTVGGSCEPLVLSLQRHAPDYIVFVCSAQVSEQGTRGSRTMIVGEGNRVCASKEDPSRTLPNVRVQAGVENVPFDLLELARIDHLESCYEAILGAFQTARAKLPHAHIVSDYTGGTKTMSAALAAVAVEDGQGKITVVSGSRSGLERVDDGTSTPLVWHPWGMHARRRFNREAGPRVASFDYAGLRTLLEDLTRDQLPDDLDARVRHAMGLCNAFDAWDRFDHLEALRILGLPHHRKAWVDHVVFLEHVCHSRSLVDPSFSGPGVPDRSRGMGFEVVDDLVLNAERCATRGRYDDAVGRLYRATELFAQIHLLKAYGLRTGDLDLTRLPEAARSGWHVSPSGKIQTGLRGAYELLRHYPDDPVGQVFTDDTTKRGDRLMNAIQIRNLSLFAHGFQPLRRADYTTVAEAVGDFLGAAIAALHPQRRVRRGLQFPTDWGPGLSS